MQENGSKLSPKHLLQVAKADIKTINSFRLGVHFHKTSGLAIDDLLGNAAKDRLLLAQRTLSNAQWAITPPSPMHRLALARAYYSMYHAARAVVYYVEAGDDHEAHTELPKHIPKDFPDRSHWENEIKTARLERNRADYDPYPRGDRPFTAYARTTLTSAEIFLPIAKQYLIRKGCKL